MRTVHIFLIGIVVGAFSTFRFVYNQIPSPQQRCEQYFYNWSYTGDDKKELMQQVKKEGLNSLKELIAKRCRVWTKNGQFRN